MEELQAALKQEVNGDSHLRNIKFQVHQNGTGEAIVTINGTVTSFYQKQMAQESVKRFFHKIEVRFKVVNNVDVTY